MQKKKWWLLLLAVCLSVSCVVVSYGKEESIEEKSTELTQTTETGWKKELYTWKAFNADAKTAGDIAEKLETVGWWPEKQNWFIGVDDTGIMDISFQSTIEDRERAEHQMMLAGIVLLTLFDDLTEIDFSYIWETNNAKVKYSLCWDLDTAKEALEGADVKSYATSEDKFLELIEIIQISSDGNN